jgi:hypothetical protein
MHQSLTAETAQQFATIALGHVRREYPNKPANAFAGPEDARTPSQLHPIFYGSLDWHSCVHGYWMLAYILRKFPEIPAAESIRSLFDEMLVPEKVAGECAYMAAPLARGFERPYGWGWLLKLSAELSLLEERYWFDNLKPLSDVFVQRFSNFLPIATYPVRVGTHFNTAFALRLAADYAEAVGDAAFGELLRKTAMRWYGGDEACPAWGEPSGDDFLSSALIEAECMRRLMPEYAFIRWFDGFLPAIKAEQPATLFSPASVSDRSDGKIAHLDGLNLSRAWCWRSLAKALPGADPRRSVMERTAAEHLGHALPHVAGDYMGEHWLASFAVLALEA